MTPSQVNEIDLEIERRLKLGEPFEVSIVAGKRGKVDWSSRCGSYGFRFVKARSFADENGMRYPVHHCFNPMS